MKNQSQTIVALQYIRGIAAILVVADHALATLAQKAQRELNLDWAWHLGELGVAIFFVISGAIMVIGHHKDFGQTNQIRIFALKRILRIIPLYWITTGIYVIKLFFLGEVEIHDLTLSLLLIPHAGADRTYGRPIYELGWTLQYEIFFYIIFALALLTSFKKGLVFICATMTLGVIYAQSINHNQNALTYILNPIILYFVAGIAIGSTYKIFIIESNKKHHLTTASAMALSSAILLFETIVWGAIEDANTRNIVHAACAILAVGVCTMTIPAVPNNQVKRIAAWLGNITYALYLTHSFVLGPAGRAVSAYWPEIPVSLFVGSMLVATLPLAHMAYIWIEKPIMDRSAKYIKQKTEARTAG